jgi:4-methylaminobutanoate oxidase (formaldehyde-forming)
MGLLDNPFEAGLGFAVDKDKWSSISRQITRRLRTLAVADEGYVSIYGGEAVLAGGEVVSRLRSCAYGFTVNKNLAYAYLPAEMKPGAEAEVEVFGRLVPALVMPDSVLSKIESRPQAG